ncbi:MAG: hypothetical protein ACSHXD_16170 [Marinosulfonomonas sp.]
MMRYVPSFDPRTGLKLILLGQLAMAGLLIASDLVQRSYFSFRHSVEIPSGPVTPGDQRREYRTDRPVPDLLMFDEPTNPPMPDEFDSRLGFTEHTVEEFGRVLLLSGEISVGDAQRFENHLSDMATKPDLIALHSPGGVVEEAQEIGRTIRDANLSTAVLAGGFCVSSCPYVLAGGENRTVSLRAIVGMHQHYYDQPRYIPVVFAVEDIQISQGETLEFLIDMGVDPSLMIYSLNTPPEQIYALVEDELEATKIALELIE